MPASSVCFLWTVVLSQGDLDLADALGGDNDDRKSCKYNGTPLTCLNVEVRDVCSLHVFPVFAGLSSTSPKLRSGH